MPMNKGPSILKEYEDRWETDMGAWFAGERVVFRGKDLFTELNDLPWMGLLLYGITGRIFDEKQIRLFEGIWSLCVSYPDPRIWNNRVAALAGSAKSTVNLGASAAEAVTEASLYGLIPLIKCIDFLQRARKILDNSEQTLSDIIITELRSADRIFGYGRPLIRGDERIAHLMLLADKLGFGNGYYVKLVFEVERILLEHNPIMKMNIASLMSALAADQGMSASEFYKYHTLSFGVGFLTCYISTEEAVEGTFFPLSSERINYTGSEYRAW